MRLALIKPFAVLFLVAWPILALCSETPASPLKFGNEIVIFTNGPGKKLRSLPAIAFGDNVYLVTWQEGWHGDGGNSRIYAARVGLDGKVLDPGGIEIAPCKVGVQEKPRVAFFSGIFLVVWQDLRNGKDCDVLGARVSLEGNVLDPQPIAIGAGPRTQSLPDVAADDQGFMVVWHGFQGEETSARIFVARVARNATAGNPAAVTEGATPRITWNGKEYLLVYSVVRPYGTRAAGQAINWLRMDTAAKVLSEPALMWGNSDYSVCAMSDGKGWLMLCPGGTPNFWGRRVGFQRAFRITLDGKLADDTPSTGFYGPKPGLPDPPNWLDSSRHNTREHKVWPWGGSALAPAGQYCVAVWQRYVIGSATGIALSNGDLRVGRVDGWKPIDGLGGIALAASSANELNPALAGSSAGRLLCVYEKRQDDGTRQICAKIIVAD